MTELVRIEVPGDWASSCEDTVFIGRALNAWLYRELATKDEGLATTLHDMPGEKPFHIALRRQPEPRIVVSGYSVLGSFIHHLAATFPERVLLNGQWWLRRQADPIVKTASWSDLAAALLKPSPESRVRFEFLSPTTFRSQGNYLPLPVPQVMFRGLLERWQTWSAVRLDRGAEDALASLVIRRFRISSVAVQLKGLVPGFVGWAELEARLGPGPYTGLLGVLGRFAQFAGVGAKVTTGFGCVESAFPTDLRQQVPLRPPPPT